MTNEAFSVLSNLNKPPTGFENLTFRDWCKLDEKVSQTVIDQFASHCQHMQELQIDGFLLESETDRKNMCDLVAKIFDSQADNQMKRLEIYSFYNKEEMLELADEDKTLIDSIVRSGQTNLTNLHLYKNMTWWGDSEASEHLCTSIQNQTTLKELVLSHNTMSSSLTEQLLSAVLESASLATIEVIYMINSADFSSDRSCTLLMQLVDRAPVLKYCDIKD